MLRKMISPVVCTDKLQFDSARFIFLLQLSGAEVVILFAQSDVRISWHLHGNKKQVHRCSCYGGTEFSPLV